jgi:hypothetical protein
MPPRSPSSAILTQAFSSNYLVIVLGFTLFLSAIGLAERTAQVADAGSSAAASELQIEIAKIGLGKEVVITQGHKEWFMRVEVTPENSVVVRQEKEGERYLLDESEMHDRAMTPAEVETAITDFINSVKTRQKVK